MNKPVSKKKLSLEFSLLTSCLIIVIVLSIFFYIHISLEKLSADVQSHMKDLNASVATATFGFLSDDIDHKNYAGINLKTKNMLTNKLISYIVVENSKTNRVEYSNISALIGKSFKRIVESKAYKEKQGTTYFIQGQRGIYVIYLGFNSQPILKSYIDTLINNLIVLVGLFVLIGLISSYLMSKIVIKPINILIKSVSKLAKGDLTERLHDSQYEEINKLVESYNSMANALQKLYSSLESEVEERTEQLKDAYKDLQNAQAMMVHSEKMKSLGEMVAGITHEINNPINFIYGNLTHLKKYSGDLIDVIDKYGEYDWELSSAHKNEVMAMKKEMDYTFLKEDLPELIKSCQEGADRAKNIILDLKNFSRMEEAVLSNVDLKKEINTTIGILQSKFKQRIKIHKRFEDNLPAVEAYGGQINQVFMNILDNASYAIKETGNVWIDVKKSGENVVISFKDDGCGMEEKTIKKIFDPFFTTKPIGHGTGLGMSISYKVIKKHGGDIKIQSKVGEGTIFTITLPIQMKEKDNNGKLDV